MSRPLLHIDAGFGVAGDMLLAALLDAGADLARVQECVAAVLPGTSVTAVATTRRQLRATAVSVVPPPGDQPDRPWSVVRDLLNAADLPDAVRDLSVGAFARLAAAEGRVHGIPPDEVRFHEVGSWDSIADVVGVAAAVVSLAVAEVSASVVGVGSGTVDTAHGTLPVPVPAVLELLRAVGAPATAGPAAFESCTPTGAALLCELVGRSRPWPAGAIGEEGGGSASQELLAGAEQGVPQGGEGRVGPEHDAVPSGEGKTGAVQDAAPSGEGKAGAVQDAAPSGEGLSRPRRRWGAMPAMTVSAVGVGAGSADPSTHPNVTRVVLGLPASDPAPGPVLLETNVDDMDPRLWPAAIDRLLAVGASDAWLTPIQMKKGRPAVTLSVLCPPGTEDELAAEVVQQTTAIGLRLVAIAKIAADRREEAVVVAGRRIRVKVASWHGRTVNVQPEWRDVAAAAEALDIPAKQVLARAQAEAVKLWPGLPRHGPRPLT